MTTLGFSSTASNISSSGGGPGGGGPVLSEKPRVKASGKKETVITEATGKEAIRLDRDALLGAETRKTKSRGHYIKISQGNLDVVLVAVSPLRCAGRTRCRLHAKATLDK